MLQQRLTDIRRYRLNAVKKLVQLFENDDTEMLRQRKNKRINKIYVTGM